mgnify:CR=1 FL=1
MIHHLSIPARDPRHVAEVLVELFGGTLTGFGPWRDQHDAPLVQERRHPDRPVRGLGVKDVVDQAQHMRRFAGGAGNKPVAMTRCSP